MAEDRDKFHRVGGNTDPKANPPSGEGPDAVQIRTKPTVATSPVRSPRRPEPRRSRSPAPDRARQADTMPGWRGPVPQTRNRTWTVRFPAQAPYPTKT